MSAIDPAVASVIAVKQSAVQSQIAFALAAKSQNAAKQQGDAIVQLLNDAADFGKALGRGEQFDARA
jgi:hypothetical protein